MELGMARGEVYLRVSVVVVLVLTACLVAFDTQTKVLLLTIEKKATYKDLNALKISVYVASVAAGYNLLQLCKHFPWFRGNFKGSSYMCMAWICFLLDQMAVYLVFAANTATFGASMLAVTGSEAFQWLKVTPLAKIRPSARCKCTVLGTPPLVEIFRPN
ncbi:hypothetical protein Fmac_013066 [Flemingia macrophylla]|uniref:CASP-like protein n=1 Tax=Flemingia macrophylla TaxID=520843 RepID=A0ABD1MS44_9FABA